MSDQFFNEEGREIVTPMERLMEAMALIFGGEKDPAWIFDLDGTLADLNGRLPYGEAQGDCVNDLVRQHVLDMLNAASEAGMWIILVSGRFDTYEKQTKEWLAKHKIPYDALFLRKASDQRSDDIIKREIYTEHIEPHYQVLKVVDDRPKVIRMWRELGLDVEDVGLGIEF